MVVRLSKLTQTPIIPSLEVIDILKLVVESSGYRDGDGKCSITK